MRTGGSNWVMSVETRPGPVPEINPPPRIPNPQEVLNGTIERAHRRCAEIRTSGRPIRIARTSHG